jgi:hypothetical protein
MSKVQSLIAVVGLVLIFVGTAFAGEEIVPPPRPDAMPPRPGPVQVCATAPVIGDLAVGPTELQVGSRKIVDLTLTGTIGFPAGCTLGSAWYVLTDEYGELDETVTIAPSADGSFSATVPVRAYRNGGDKDGRLYQITVGASNEAGSVSSAPLSVVVQHDSR